MPNNLPEPETRKEMFLSSAAGAPVEVPTPITREEIYLDAIAKGGGVSPDDAYTKAQTDALLAEKANADDVYTKAQTNVELAKKVDKETGKGLSTNDFTDADKANLTTALTTANAAAPQSTTYNKIEVDTALAEKLNTADVDESLSSTSTNPVQNKAVQAQIARLVDAGAKNILKIQEATQETAAGATFVSDGKNAITISGTVGDPWGTWSFIGSYSNKDTIMDCTNDNYVVSVISETENINLLAYDYSGSNRRTLFSFSGSGTAVFSGNITNIQLAAKTGTFSGEKVKIMICSAEDYALSPDIVPHTPTMRELYEMILALQNGG